MAFFFKRAIAAFDHVAKTTSALDIRLARIEGIADEFRDLKQDVKKALIAAARIKSLGDQIAVLQRDQQSIWRKIDELKEEVYGRNSITNLSSRRD